MWTNGACLKQATSPRLTPSEELCSDHGIRCLADIKEIQQSLGKKLYTSALRITGKTKLILGWSTWYHNKQTNWSSSTIIKIWLIELAIELSAFYKYIEDGLIQVVLFMLTTTNSWFLGAWFIQGWVYKILAILLWYSGLLFIHTHSCGFKHKIITESRSTYKNYLLVSNH